MSKKRKLKKAIKRWVDQIDDDNDLLDSVTSIELKCEDEIVASGSISVQSGGQGPTCDPIIGCKPPSEDENE